MSLSLHCNGEIRETDSYDTRQITSLLLRISRLTGSSRFTHATSLRVRIVSGFMPVIRTMTCPDHRRKTEGYSWPISVQTTRGSPLPTDNCITFHHHHCKSVFSSCIVEFKIGWKFCFTKWGSVCVSTLDRPQRMHPQRVPMATVPTNKTIS